MELSVRGFGFPQPPKAGPDCYFLGVGSMSVLYYLNHVVALYF